MILFFLLLLGHSGLLFSGEMGYKGGAAQGGGAQEEKQLERKDTRTSISSEESIRSRATEICAHAGDIITEDTDDDAISVESNDSVVYKDFTLCVADVPLDIQRRMRATSTGRGWVVSTYRELEVSGTVHTVYWDIEEAKIEDFVTEGIQVVYGDDILQECKRIYPKVPFKDLDSTFLHRYACGVRRINKGVLPLTEKACRAIAAFAKLSENKTRCVYDASTDLQLHPGSRKSIQRHAGLEEKKSVERRVPRVIHSALVLHPAVRGPLEKKVDERS